MAHDIDIDPGKPHKVHPDKEHVKQGEKITWKNKTKDKAVVGFWDECVFDSVKQFVILPNESLESPEVSHKCSDGGYTYMIFCYDPGEFLIWNGSGPKIVIP